MSLQAVSVTTANHDRILSLSDPKLKLTKDNGKVRRIPTYKTIKVWVNNTTEPLKGKYKVISDSTIEIAGEVVAISDIEKISGFTWPSILSPILIGGGATAVGYGGVIAYLGAFYAMVGFGPGLFVAGLGLAGVGTAAILAGVFIWHHSKTFRIGEKWQVEIEERDPFSGIFRKGLNNAPIEPDISKR